MEVTSGAIFDYEEIVCKRPFDPGLKPKVEKELRGANKRELRLIYTDEKSGKELLLFIEEGYVFGLMRIWFLRGICELKDYTEEMERNGAIKKWLEVEIP